MSGGRVSKRISEKYVGVIPVPKDMKAVAGIYVGGCVEVGKIRRGVAHAHIHKHEKYYGWICFRSSYYFYDLDTRMHELAHIVTGQGHTREWCQEYDRLLGKRKVAWRYRKLLG